MPNSEYPYFYAAVRLALALALGLFVGLERERREKKAGLRTFGLAALMGAVGGLLGETFAILALILLGILMVLLNIQLLLEEGKTVLTTSVAFLLTGWAGVLCGQGHTLTPTAISVVTAALLAWKRSLSNLTLGLTEQELRSAILLAILAFVIYPALPEGSLDQWDLIEPRTLWIMIIVIAGIGFVNYVLWKLYGKRGIQLGTFLGGLVNSSVAVNNLAKKVRKSEGKMTNTFFTAIVLSVAAMLLRNIVLLAVLAPDLLLASLAPFILMIVGGGFIFFIYQRDQNNQNEKADLDLKLKAPFSLIAAFRFGFVLLAIQVISILAQQAIGQSGLLAVSFLGGLYSSASTLAATVANFQNGVITMHVGTISVVIILQASVLINWVLALRARDKQLRKKLSILMGMVIVFGIIGIFVQSMIF